MRIITTDTTVWDVCDKNRKALAYEIRGAASLTCVLIAVTAKDTDYSVRIVLNGSGARASVYGIVIGKKTSRIRLHTEQIHAKPNATSTILVKSVLYDASVFTYDGTIRVEQDAQKTDAYQRNENLIVGGSARAHSKPSLEILAHDVRCTHGATVGPDRKSTRLNSSHT